MTNDSTTDAIAITNIVVSPPFLEVNDSCGSSIPIGGTCHVDIAFHPIGAGKAKAEEGLTFIDSGKKSPQHVELEGRGIIGPTPTPTATASATATATETITATGTATSTPTATSTATSTPPFSVYGMAVQNGMNGAAISAFAVKSDGADGSALGTTTADANGKFSISIDPPSNTPVRLRASGGTYVSEENGATISSPSPLSVLLPAVQKNLSGLSINPLTTFVDSVALGNISGGQDLATALGNSTTSIERDYGISSDPSTLTPLYDDSASDAAKLGMILGALVNEDQLACASSPGGLVTALSSDIADGVFDGMSFGTPVSYCAAPLPAIAGTAQFSDALSGLQGLTIATSGFTFGGPDNPLTIDGYTAGNEGLDVSIEEALVAAAPPSSNSFLSPDSAVMNVGRENDTATLLPNGKVLIAGGSNVSRLASTELYDPAGNTFLTSGTATMNGLRSSASATLLPNGKVLIAGGFAFGVALRSTELYDPASNTFLTSGTANMRATRSGATATLLGNGKVLLAGGYGVNGDILASVEMYNPATNAFTLIKGMNVARDGATATLLPSGQVLIAAGYNDTGALASIDVYDPASKSFLPPGPAGGLGTLNTARESAAAALLPNGFVLIAGGQDSNGNPLASTEVCDISRCLSSAPTMTTARSGATATLLPNGDVLIAGGMDASGNPLASTELYDWASNTFLSSGAPSMTIGRASGSATLLPNGKVLIAGGLSSAGTHPPTTDLYTP